MSDPPDSSQLLANAARSIERRDAEILLASSWKLTRSQLLARDGVAVPSEVAARFGQWCAQRAAGMPVAYLLGRREFWSLEFEVTPAVLVPRPETELLVQLVLDGVSSPNAHVVDLGTGSGAIAIALAHERPAWHVTASDRSVDALAVARRNGERIVPGGIEWLTGDWYAPLAGRKFHAVVSNPPYIAAGDPVLGGDGLRHEPRIALTPGGDGFGALITLINGAASHLEVSGLFAVEHGATQAGTLRDALVARGFTHVTSHRDLAGHERVTIGIWPNR